MDTALADSIRRCVHRGQYEQAVHLWSQYTAQIQQEIARGTCTAERITAARLLLEWTRRETTCARSHTQDRINSTRLAVHYGAHPAQPVPSLQTTL